MPSDRDFDDLGWEACDLETDWMLGPLSGRSWLLMVLICAADAMPLVRCCPAAWGAMGCHGMPWGWDGLRSVEDLLSYNFESPFQSGRLTALRQMLQARPASLGRFILPETLRWLQRSAFFRWSCVQYSTASSLDDCWGFLGFLRCPEFL